MTPLFLANSLRIRNSGATRNPKEAVTRREGDRRAGEPEQSPTPRSFAGLVKREEVIAKPGTTTCFLLSTNRYGANIQQWWTGTFSRSTTVSTKNTSTFICSSRRSARCRSGSTSSRERSERSAARRSASRIPSQFDEIVPRRCRGCGRLTRLLRAVPCLYGWRERCDDCAFRHPLLFEGRAP